MGLIKDLTAFRYLSGFCQRRLNTIDTKQHGMSLSKANKDWVHVNNLGLTIKHKIEDILCLHEYVQRCQDLRTLTG